MGALQAPRSMSPQAVRAQADAEAPPTGAPVAESASDAPLAIRTPDQRIRVFASSTLDELAPERAAARQAITQLRLIPVMFELGARPHPPRDLYRAYLAQSDVFVMRRRRRSMPSPARRATSRSARHLSAVGGTRDAVLPGELRSVLNCTRHG
jgi:Domain of unknown function (DUF4062)